jgi:hypothetical protein
MRGAAHSAVAVVALLGALFSAPTASALDYALAGHLQWESFAYPDGAGDTDDWENFFELETRFRTRLTSQLTFRFESRLVADDSQFTSGFYSVRNDQTRRPYLSIVSGALDYRPAEWIRLSAGKILGNWSIIDEIEPANLLSARDETDIFRRSDLGVYGLAAHFEHDIAYVDLMVVGGGTSSRPTGKTSVVKSTCRRCSSRKPRPASGSARSSTNSTSVSLRMSAATRCRDSCPSSSSSAVSSASTW